MIQKINFGEKNHKEFFTTLRKRVDAYFKDNNKSKHANGEMIFKTLFIFAGLFGCFFSLLFLELPAWAFFLVYATMGFFGAMVGLCIGHDSIHGSYSNKPIVNRILSLSFDLIGASSYLWSIMHNKAHHTFTNIEGYDEDIESVPIMRLSPHKKLEKIHKYQHIFAFPLYTLGSLSWVLMKDYKKFFQSHIGGIETPSHAPIEYVKLFVYKAISYFIWIGLPFMLITHLPWYFVLLGFLLCHAVEGFTIAIIFMLAHVVEECTFPMPDKDGSLENSWAVHQLYTTANFARKNRILNFICGGLNFQVEHHLFPHICHTHYLPISEIVKKTAEEFGYPYNDAPTFGAAVRSHYRFLKKMGSDPQYRLTT